MKRRISGMEKYKQEFIEFMVDCEVLKFGDFVTKSGRKTPFFVSLRKKQGCLPEAALGDYLFRATTTKRPSST